MNMTFVSYARDKKFVDILIKDNIVTDLRIPKSLIDNIKNIIISGQVWGRRGNTKLITIILFTSQFNSNKDIKEDMENLIKDEDKNCRIKYHDTYSTMTINIFSRNLSSVLKGVEKAMNYLKEEQSIDEELISITVSTDLPNWRGINYYTTDLFTLLNIIQTHDVGSQHGIFYLNPDNIEDIDLLLMIQTALAVYPRIMIKLDSDDMGKEFLIQRIRDLVLETRTLVNLRDLDKILVIGKEGKA